MKIIPQKPQSFQPFSILVESVQEANLLASLIGSTNAHVTNAFGIDAAAYNAFYCELSKHADAEESLEVDLNSHI